MNVLSVMAHQDDELMCLGTMLRMREAGHRLRFVSVTDGSGGMAHHPEMSREEAAAVRDREMRELASGCDATYRCLGEQDEFLYDSPDLRVRLIEAIRAAGADVIFTHFGTDYNLDHMTVNLLVRQCAMQAPFPMIRTESPPLATTPAVFTIEPIGGFEFEASHYVDITEIMGRKMELALCHKSQDEAFRAAFGTERGLNDWVRETAKSCGGKVGVSFAEGFRPMLARGLVKPYSILP